jgi:DNA ligase-1
MKPKKIKINNTITKPLLAETVESLSALSYPVLVSPKLDGIRCLVIGGKALTRKFEPVPNHYVRNWIEENLPDGFDGELCVDGKTFNETQSLIMREEGEPDFNLSLFDYVSNNNLAERFEERYKKLVNYTKSIGKEINSRVRLVKHYIANNEQEVL